MWGEAKPPLTLVFDTGGKAWPCHAFPPVPKTNVGGGLASPTPPLLIDRLNKTGVRLYIADAYVVYENLIPVGKLYQGKDKGIERNNGRQRHWFARFRRKSIVVSKTKRMVDVTMALFARFRVNGLIEELARWTLLSAPA